MKKAYPIILTPDDVGFTVFIPDFDINTQGDSLAEAIEMAKDAIGLMGIDMEDDKKAIPEASAFNTINHEENEIVTLVVVDFAEYRRKNEMKVVKKNCTLPSWLCYEAEKANINFSQVLQAGLKRELNIAD
ncbi:MAG: type II toxin-antitoxin system HicB family antitoxin [Acutalibacteraceae bacterium]|nr:type II toxin-antitoxin system HicB family antitoxin [Acutalibacteraceae bacterium]